MTDAMPDARLAEIKAWDAERNRLLVEKRPNSAVAHRHELLAEVERLRTELSESQRRFDALVSADKAQQGATDWMLNALLNAGKIDHETYDSLAGLLRDQINAKMCLRHPEDWTPLVDRHRKALAELAELREQLGNAETEWGYGDEPDDVDPIGDRSAARDCAQAYGASVFVRSIFSGPWRRDGGGD